MTRPPSPPRAGTRARAAVAAALALFAAGACGRLVTEQSSFLCDPTAPFASDVCMAGWYCGPAGTCIPAPNPCTQGSCPSGMSCDLQTLACVPDGSVGSGTPGDADATDVSARDGGPGDANGSGPGEASTDGAPPPCTGVGCPCTTNAQCVGGTFCGNTLPRGVGGGVFGDAGGDSGTSYCIQPCCSSSDCNRPNVCFATAAGGNYCVPPGTLGDRGAIGASIGGTPCDGGAAAACRSGLCVGGSCIDTCCSANVPPGAPMQCARSGSACRFGPFPGNQVDSNYTAFCTTMLFTGRGGGTGSPCGAPADCQSNLCIVSGGAGTCHDPCSITSTSSLNGDCPTGGFGTPAQNCAYLQPDPTEPTIVAACTADAGPTTSVCFTSGDCPSATACELGSEPIGATTYSVLTCR